MYENQLHNIPFAKERKEFVKLGFLIKKVIEIWPNDYNLRMYFKSKIIFEISVIHFFKQIHVNLRV